MRGGTDVVLRLDVQGAATVRSLLKDSISIFLVRCLLHVPSAHACILHEFVCERMHRVWKLHTFWRSWPRAEGLGITLLCVLCSLQVAESEAALVQRLIDRKTEPVVRWVCVVWSACGRLHVTLCLLCCRTR
jgi:hypothetical protein